MNSLSGGNIELSDPTLFLPECWGNLFTLQNNQAINSTLPPPQNVTGTHNDIDMIIEHLELTDNWNPNTLQNSDPNNSNNFHQLSSVGSGIRSSPPYSNQHTSADHGWSNPQLETIASRNNISRSEDGFSLSYYQGAENSQVNQDQYLMWSSHSLNNDTQQSSVTGHASDTEHASVTSHASLNHNFDSHASIVSRNISSNSPDHQFNLAYNDGVNSLVHDALSSTFMNNDPQQPCVSEHVSMDHRGGNQLNISWNISSDSQVEFSLASDQQPSFSGRSTKNNRERCATYRAKRYSLWSK